MRLLGDKQESVTVPRGPKGERRPADLICNAVKVIRIATREGLVASLSHITAIRQ
jgi:hypothetical protein